MDYLPMAVLFVFVLLVYIAYGKWENKKDRERQETEYESASDRSKWIIESMQKDEAAKRELYDDLKHVHWVDARVLCETQTGHKPCECKSKWDIAIRIHYRKYDDRKNAPHRQLVRSAKLDSRGSEYLKRYEQTKAVVDHKRPQ